MKRILSVVNALALAITITINYLSNTGLFNNNTMKTVSDKYHNLFTPAGYAFSIWGLIYLGLLGFVIYSLVQAFGKKESLDDENEILKTGWLFALSCVLNIAWVYSWLNDLIGLSVIVMVLLLATLMGIVIRLRMELDYHPLKKYVFIFWPFAIYAGWVSVALVADVAAWLTKIGWGQFGISSVSWAVIMLVVASLSNLLMIWTRNLREFAFAGIWAFVAIAVENPDAVFIEFTAYTAAALLLLNIGIHGLLQKREPGKF